MKWFLLLLLLLIILFVIWWFIRRQSASADPMDAYSPTSEDRSGSSATTDAGDTGNGWEAEPVAAAPMVEAPAAEAVDLTADGHDAEPEVNMPTAQAAGFTRWDHKD